MGYCIDQDELLVKIPLSKRAELLAVFKKLKDDEQSLGRGGSSTVKWYSFANDFEYSEDIVAMFDAFRYECREEGEFFIIDSFVGEKWGQDDLLWKRLKPLLTEDSVCTFYGEDHSHIDFLK